MSFKNLNLDQSKLDDAIEQFGLDEKPKIEKKGYGTHYIIRKDGKEALVIFFLTRKGQLV